jgi:hypothetical protein
MAEQDDEEEGRGSADGGGTGVRGGQLQGGGVGRRGGCGAGGRRGGKELQACVMPHHPGGGGGRKQYVLRSLHDPNYLLGFVDRHVLRGTVNCSVSPRGLKNR